MSVLLSRKKSDPELIDHRTDWFVRCNGCNVIVYGETVNHIDHINDDKEAQGAFDAVDWDALRQTAIDRWNTRCEKITKRQAITELLALHEQDRAKVNSQCDTLINISTVDKYLEGLE